MRSSVAFCSSTTAFAAMLGMVAVLSCGGEKPKPKSAVNTEPSGTDDKSSDVVAPEDKATVTEKTDPEPAASAAGPKEAPCSFDTSQPATSKASSVKITTGCVSPEKALKLLEQYYPQMHACFTPELRAHPKAKGEVNIKINVGQRGTYSVRVTKGDTTSEEFVKCMVGVLEPLPYPKPEVGGATIEFVTQLK